LTKLPVLINFSKKKNMSKLSRRSFLKASLTTASGLAITPKNILSAESEGLYQSSKTYDAKGLPTSVLGKTGVTVPRLAFGLGSRYCNVKDEDEAIGLLEKALDEGLYYWDTASDYSSSDGKVKSEERVGKAMKGKRNQVFLSTKVLPRDPSEALRSIELSLNRLQTDRIDVLNIHAVRSLEDNKEILKKGGLLDILYRMKEEKVTRFIGMSGHADPAAMTELIDKAELDCVIVAMNHYPRGLDNTTPRLDHVIPKAKEKNMGRLLMKVIRPLDTMEGLEINPEQLLRYALSHDDINAVTIGMDSMEVLKSNIKTLREFTPMNEGEKQVIAQALAPYFNSKDLPWLDSNYRDGNWV